jgi:hypothetical protein
MSYTDEDAAWDEAYDRMSEELYPGHKAQAIVEFSYERLRSFYVKNPDVLVPAVRSFKIAKASLASEQPAAALVFAASSMELFLKGALLRPVVYGLVHSDALAELVVEAALSQTGFRRYEKLLAGLFKEIAGVDIEVLRRDGGKTSLLKEAHALQTARNGVIHQGNETTTARAEEALAISNAVLAQVLWPVLNELGLSIQKGGHLVDDEKEPSS